MKFAISTMETSTGWIPRSECSQRICPTGFGFSDTAFRVFILMASRRLKSDRFFTTDWRTEDLHASRHGLD